MAEAEGEVFSKEMSASLRLSGNALMRSDANDRKSETSENVADWVDRARGGCEDAFTALFRCYYEQIRGFSYRIVLDPQSADDIAQETFLRAAGRIGQLRCGDSFEPWLYQIARNLARDCIRKEKAHRRKIERYREQMADASGGADGAVQSSSDAAAAALEALAKLSPAQREAVALVYLEGYSHDEAAERLGCAASTVSWRIFRAKSILRTKLAGQAGK